METREPKERPIIFSGLMVEAILEGRKTQTRRVIKPQPSMAENGVMAWKDIYATDFDRHAIPIMERERCPYGKPGDRLWVRETFERIHRGTKSGGSVPMVVYVADGEERVRYEDGKPAPKRYASIFMPRSLSRILLEVVSVRVERLQELSCEDAQAEDCRGMYSKDSEGIKEELMSPEDAYAQLWESINGKKSGCSWEHNPWVWVIEFKRIEVVK